MPDPTKHVPVARGRDGLGDNVFSFIDRSRYLPDRRDLNRVFPGSAKGSLAARLAHLFMTEIVANCTHGIDLHTGSNHRSNLPQIRAWLDDPETGRLAYAFGVPVILNANLHDGSLRQAAVEAGIPMLLYEGGEALRFDEVAVRAGLKAILAVMRSIGILPAKPHHTTHPETFVARSSAWIRAPEGGILRTTTQLGTRVTQGQILGLIIGSLLGGLTTLIGTPPNILASDALRDFGLSPFQLFDFAPVGLAVMVGLYILTTLATQVMPNPAVVVLMAPIALNAARDIGISPYALMMTVALSASASFLSPVAHPANVLIMGPGGYRFSDYIKVGVPLTLVVLLVTLLVLPLFWPLFP